MKMTKRLLKEIIEEEISIVLSEQLDNDFIRSVSRAAVKAYKASKTKSIWNIGMPNESKIEPGSVELFLTFKQGMEEFKENAISKLNPALEQWKQKYNLNGTFEIKPGSRGGSQLSLFFKPSSGAASPRKRVQKPSAAPSVKPARTSSPKNIEDFKRSVSRAAAKGYKASGTKDIWGIGGAFESKIEPGSLELFLTFKQGMEEFKDKAISKLKPALEQWKQKYNLNGTFEIKIGSRGGSQLSLFFKPS